MKKTAVNNEEPPPLLDRDKTQKFSKVVIVHTDVQREDFASQEAFIAENECILRSQQVAEKLEKLGVSSHVIPANSQLSNRLIELKPELCINFVDTVHGSGALAASIPGVFELLGIPYVGAGTLSLAINNNKYLTKTLLETWGLPTPQYQLFRQQNQALDYDLRFPLIVKLNEEHGSVGIDQNSVVSNEKELRAQLKFLIETYQQPALVEEFIEDAKELTGVVLEAKRTTKVFLSERDFAKPKKGFKLLTFDTKWATDLGLEEPVSYLPYREKNLAKIRSIKNDLRKCFDILKMDDLGRFDILIDKYGNHFIVDCNANPSLGPESSVARAIKAANGQKFETVLLNILERNHQDLLKK